MWSQMLLLLKIALHAVWFRFLGKSKVYREWLSFSHWSLQGRLPGNARRFCDSDPSERGKSLLDLRLKNSSLIDSLIYGGIFLFLEICFQFGEELFSGSNLLGFRSLPSDLNSPAVVTANPTRCDALVFFWLSPFFLQKIPILEKPWTLVCKYHHFLIGSRSIFADY